MNNAAENNTQKNNNGISQKDDRCCKLSVVVSVYNEEKALREFYKETNKILEQIKNAGWEHELIFVNDGSADNSLSILEEIAHEDHDVKLISFSRNFGHEAAMIAGIDYSTTVQELGSSAWMQTFNIPRNVSQRSSKSLTMVTK